METKMKTIMGALAASLLLAGAAAPASADTEELIEVVREYVRVPSLGADEGREDAPLHP